MHRFYLPCEQCHAADLTLPEREARHAVQVLRLACGAPVVVLDGAGHELCCEVTMASPRAVCLRVRQRKEVAPPPFRITLLQAVPKGRVLEDIIEQATELGVHRVVPVLSERVVMRLNAEDRESKIGRWRQSAIEAIKQSGNAWLPRVDAPLTLEAFVARDEPFDLAMVGSLTDAPCHLRERLREYVHGHQRLPVSVAVWIGPEGDFTALEMEAIKASGALPVSLGQRVLRCETAALYCLSVLNHELTAPQ